MLCIDLPHIFLFARMLGPRKSEYERKRKAKDIAIRYLGSESQRAELRDTATRLHRFDYRILPGYLAGYVNTDIWSEYLALTFLGEPVRITTIKSADMAQGYAQFFEAIWNGSAK